MFLACPHCGYLVALIVAKDGPQRACPRCGGSLQGQAAQASAAAAPETAATAAQDQDQDQAAPTTPADSAPLRDDISLALRRAPTAAARDEAAAPLAKPGLAAQAGRDASDGDDSDDSDSLATPDADGNRDADASIDPARAADEGDKGERGRDQETTREETTHAETASALPPLTAATAATAPAAARGRRQRKSETTVTSARRAPSFARQQARAQAPKPRLHWSGPVAIAALALALALQLLLAQRAELAADVRWRPLLGGVCGALGCTLPPWREPAALTMLNRNVLPVADRAGVLRVAAGFRNDARWPQPWPTLVLSLEDVDGRRVGQRAFAPGEYRRDHRPGELIAPGQSAAVQFEVIEPAPRVVAFTFDFR